MNAPSLATSVLDIFVHVICNCNWFGSYSFFAARPTHYALVTMLVGTSTVTVVTQIVEKVSDRQHPLARLERILKAAGIETPNLYCGNQLAEVKKGEVVFLPPGAIWFSKAKDCHFARTQLILHPEALPAQFFVVMGLDTGNTDWAVWWIGSNDPQFGTIHKNEPNVRVTWGGILNWQPK